MIKYHHFSLNFSQFDFGTLCVDFHSSKIASAVLATSISYGSLVLIARVNYNDWQNGIHATTKYLEMFFENLLMSVGHELKNRYMHIDYENQRVIQSANISNSKCNNCTLGELAIINELIKKPEITQKELASIIGKSERTIKTRTVEMQEKGLICRENGKRNGKWKVLVEIQHCEE